MVGQIHTTFMSNNIKWKNKRSLYGCFFTFNAPFLSSIFATESESMVLEKAGHGVLCWYLVSLWNKSWPHSLQTYLPGNKSFIYIISEFRWTLILSIYFTILEVWALQIDYLHTWFKVIFVDLSFTEQTKWHFDFAYMTQVSYKLML